MNSKNDHEAKGPDQPDTHDLLKLEHLCSVFERDWTVDSVSTIANLVLQTETRLQSMLAAELVTTDMEMRHARNESFDTDGYLKRLPGFSQAIEEAISDWRETIAEPEGAHGAQPTRIGDYQILRLIGTGGAGAVYEGIQKSLGRKVAIKTLMQGHLNSRVSRFRREAKAIALLHHTNIVKVFGSGIHKRTPYFAMQLIEGRDLAEVIKTAREGKSQWAGLKAQKNVARIGLQVARALEHAHERGVLHRDIKPSNLLLDENGTTWVTDFGLAKLVDDHSQHAKTAGIVGTIRYVPPEGFSGSWDERSDVYSLGLTLHELLTLKPAFEGDDYRQLITRISHEPPGGQLQKMVGLNKDLETIILKAAAKDPKQRYQSAGELADELQRYLDGIPIKARPVSTLDKTLRWAKRSPTAAALAAMTLLVAFVGLPVLLWLWLRASSALTTVKAQRETAVQLQRSIEKSRVDAVLARYSSTSQLAQNYIDQGLAVEARRTLEILQGILGRNRNAASSTPWEISYLNEQLETSQMTLSGDERYGVWKVAVRPDDAQIATVHAIDPENNELKGEVILWDRESGQREHVLDDHGSRVFGCNYSRSGKTIATIGMNLDEQESRGTLCLWDVETGARINRVNLPGPYDVWQLRNFTTPVLPQVEFSNDDKLIVTSPMPIEVRDAETMEVVWACKGQHALVLPENRLLVHRDYGLEIRNLSTGEQITSKHQFKYENLKDFRLRKDGTGFSCTLADKIRIWDSLADFSSFKDIVAQGIYWGAVSPNRVYAVHGARKSELKLEKLDQTNAEPAQSLLGHLQMSRHGCFGRNGSWLVTGGEDGTARIWSTKTERRRTETRLMHERISNICFDAEGDQIHFVARRVDAGRNPGNAGTIDTSNGNFSREHIETTHAAAWPRSDFSFNSNGSMLAAPVSEPERPDPIRGNARVSDLGIWDCDTWKQRCLIKTSFTAIDSIQWSHDSKLIAVAGTSKQGHSIEFFGSDSGSYSILGQLVVDGFIESMGFSQSAFAAATESRLSVWTLNQNSGGISFGQLFDFQYCGKLESLDFSPNGKSLAAADWKNEDLVVFDVLTGEERYRRAGPRAICCVCYSPCGTRLALSGYDSIVHLCDAQSGYRLLTLAGSDVAPGTHAINSKVVFSPDGRKIATNTWRGHIRFWEVGGDQVE